jgi:DNA repair protein RecO (recombination protein O)
MNQVVTTGIVLTRTDFGEADRIITVLTPDRGKLRLIAKGVRKIKSKLAGGIELFSVSQLTYIPGRKEIHTLVSSRLETHYGKIVTDLPRTMLAYELMKRINRATEDETDAEYFELLNISLKALDEGVNETIMELWFDARLLRLAGHQPNLSSDSKGVKLEAGKLYTFDFDHMAFATAEQGVLTPDHIKFLRLVFGVHDPMQLQQVKDASKVIGPCFQLVTTMRKTYIRGS